MKAAKLMFAMALSGIAFASSLSHGIAQQVTGVLGSPDATTTIDGRYLPPPPQPFTGPDRAERRSVHAGLADARGAAEGRAEHPADHDRRRRLCARRPPSAA